MIDIREFKRRKRQQYKEITALGFPYIFSRHVSPEPNSGCWLWSGASINGYGSVGHPVLKKTYFAHRYVYETLVGEIAENLELDHTCNVPCCVNPDHLELVTRQENMRRARDRFRKNGKCKKGHDLTGDNLYVDPRENYICRACRNAAARRFRKRASVMKGT